jgi:hypothetical protein
MNKKWFKEYGLVYLPISWQGFLTTFIAVIFNVHVFLAVDNNSHSVSDTFYGIFPYFVGSLAILFWIASKTSRK